MLLDPFNRTRLPGDFSREGRIALLGEAFSALLRGEMPSPEAAMFLGGAGLAWLESGGSLERDHFRVVRAKSHHTPAVVWRSLKGDVGEAHQDERQDDELPQD